MQDPLTSSFRWGETFDTAPYAVSFHPAERFTRREVDRASETRKNFAFYLHMNLESKGYTSNL